MGADGLKDREGAAHVVRTEHFGDVWEHLQKLSVSMCKGRCCRVIQGASYSPRFGIHRELLLPGLPAVDGV